MRRLVPLVVLVSTLALPREANPCGPGIHAREAQAALDLLAQADPTWAERKGVPRATSWLVLGTIAPDLQWWLDGLSYGHENRLSYALVDRGVAKGPEYALLGFGHLAHVTASDPACEQFLSPTIVASAPVGMVDLFAGDQSPEGATAGSLTELYGDFILGDWGVLVDAIYDFHLDGEEADARLHDAVLWYCQTANEILPASSDCEDLYQQLAGMFAAADQFLGTMSREDAKAMLLGMLGQPLPDLMDLWASGTLNALLGMTNDKSPNFDEELARLKSGPLVDPAFWALYDSDLAQNGPRWTLARLAERNDGWPAWVGPAIVCGNVQSIMNFLPDAYAVTPGIVVDAVRWRDASGKEIASLPEAADGQAASVTLRWYSARAFEGTLRGVVRADAPGLDPAKDTIAGEASVSVVADPWQYVTVPRAELAIPFTVGTYGWQGFYVDLYANGSDKPTFTTSWDRLWRIADLPLDHAVYRDNFGTYGHYPPSLPIARDAPLAKSAVGMVKVRVAPTGPAVAGVKVGVAPAGGTQDEPDIVSEATTAANGIAVLDKLDAGTEYTLFASAPGFDAGLPGTLVTGTSLTWTEVAAHALAQPAPPAWLADRRCATFTYTTATFAGQAAAFYGWASDPATDTEGARTDLGTSGAATVCLDTDIADGGTIAVHVQAKYVDGTDGVEDAATTRVDGSGPLVPEASVTAREATGCFGGGNPAARPFDLAFGVLEPDSPITAIAWRAGGGDWIDLGVDQLPQGVTGQVRPLAIAVDVPPEAPGADVTVRVTNAAGVATEKVAGTVPSTADLPPCAVEETPEPSVSEEVPAVDPGGSGSPDVVREATAPVVEETTTPKGGSSGCAAGGTPGRSAALLIAALACLFAASRRRRPA